VTIRITSLPVCFCAATFYRKGKTTLKGVRDGRGCEIGGDRCSELPEAERSRAVLCREILDVDGIHPWIHFQQCLDERVVVSAVGGRGRGVVN